ncbi:MAG: hypothetical protein HYX63_09475 [Gammaproteobacteria bacterium]|nr:hypothetical protein [Gammaproteobacteria bacterium]
MRNLATVPAGERALPVGFEGLEEFVAYWAVPGQNERRYQRCDTTFDEIKRFYDAMYSRADEAMTYLDKFPLRDMPGPEARLMRMVLSLAQASMAVEIQGAPRVPNAPWPDSVKILTTETL